MSGQIGRLVPHILFSLTTVLVLFGLVTVYSAGAFFDYRSIRNQWEKTVETAITQAIAPDSVEGKSDDPFQTLKQLQAQGANRRASTLSTFLHQTIWVVIGFLALAITARFDYPIWGRRIGWIVLILFSLQLALTLIPAGTNWPIRSLELNYAKSRLSLFGFTIQPSELAKLILIIFTSWFLSRRVQEDRMSLSSLLPVLLIIAPSIGMILLESDRGVAAHLCLALALLWFFSGGKIGHFAVLSVVGIFGVGFMVLNSEEAKSRIVNFFTGQPEYQYQQALEGVSRGGLFGVGLGDGEGSLTLYGAHNDVILAVVGEELGFIVTAAVVLAYLTLILLGLRISKNCDDPFGKILALGITILLGTQALLNIAITLNLLPPTGFTLPLLSAGGASMVTTMAAIGILINISLSTHDHLLDSRKRTKVGGLR
ncbi:MAG: FtsW/RodA/SpoVE family cell cycle protein, partial [Candidatus Omnitrophica bacterium]|nr:FtsW/RodA/SpoVE family cell cycle protein [Candidatus Omnitrophota bacterium]